MTSDEIVRVEQFKIERFMGLGLGRYEAIRGGRRRGRLACSRGASDRGLHARRRARNLALSPRALRLDAHSPSCIRPLRDGIGRLLVVGGWSRYPDRIVGDHRGDLRENLNNPQHLLVEGEGVARAPIGIF
jgi:hypothetical protein